jgi:hypothetical protein
MHLGAEGGIGARQTTGPTGSEVPDSSTTTAPTETEFSAGESKPARVTIAFDDGGEAKEGTYVTMNNTEESEGQKKKAKPKGKRVLFQSDKPEIYDF